MTPSTLPALPRRRYDVVLSDAYGSQTIPVWASCPARAAYLAATTFRRLVRGTTPRLVSITPEVGQ